MYESCHRRMFLMEFMLSAFYALGVSSTVNSLPRLMDRAPEDILVSHRSGLEPRLKLPPSTISNSVRRSKPVVTWPSPGHSAGVGIDYSVSSKEASGRGSW